LMVTLAATMLWAASWLGDASALALCFIVLIASAVAAGMGCWLFLENDVVHFGVIGAVVGFLSSFLGAVYYLSVPGGIVLGVIVGDVLSDLRREPLFEGQCRRQRSWQLIARGDRVPLARLALAVACLAALCPLAGFWIANAINPAGIELNALAAEFWKYGVQEWASRQPLLDGVRRQLARTGHVRVMPGALFSAPPTQGGTAHRRLVSCARVHGVRIGHAPFLASIITGVLLRFDLRWG
jgi:hypothetical protein